jgi:hypothetical protein
MPTLAVEAGVKLGRRSSLSAYKQAEVIKRREPSDECSGIAEAGRRADGHEMKAQRLGATAIAKALKIGRAPVYRALDDALAFADKLGRSVSSGCPGVFLGFLRIAVVEGPLGAGPTVQIFDDDVVAFTRLTDLLLSSTTFSYLRDCRLGDAEAYHADGNCHTNECNPDTAQSLLPDVHGLRVRSHSSARVPLPWGELRAGHSRPRA